METSRDQQTDRFCKDPSLQAQVASSHTRHDRSVIFLDIDGVLNRKSITAKPKAHVVDPVLLKRLERLVSSTGANVVLASTWRHEPGGLETARDLGIPFVDVIPDLRPHSRGEEIRAWLMSHDVKRFVIIDDDDDCYDDFALFQPNPYEGLSPELVAAIEEYMTGRRNKDWRRSIFVRACQYLKAVVGWHRG